jgi:hypothetical protein
VVPHLQESFRLAADGLHGPCGSEAVDHPPVRVSDKALRDAIRIEHDLNAHVASRGVRFEMDVRHFERLGQIARRVCCMRGDPEREADRQRCGLNRA